MIEVTIYTLCVLLIIVEMCIIIASLLYGVMFESDKAIDVATFTLIAFIVTGLLCAFVVTQEPIRDIILFTI